MKKNPISLITGGLLLLIFLALIFCFQVRSTEVAVVTTFGRYSRTVDQAGLYFRLPQPFQKVYKFDQRIQTFDRKYEQNVTRDKKTPVISVFVGWRIDDGRLFLELHNGDLTKAELALESIVRDAKNSVIGRHDFSELVSPDPTKVKFDQIEAEMKEAMDANAKKAAGVKIELVGIKQLGLPESLTAKVFDRMKTEREKLVKAFAAEGEAQAIKIRSEADRERTDLLANAGRQANSILGGAEAKATESYKVLNQEPEFAEFLLKLRGLEQFKDRTTLILDAQTPPLDLLRGSSDPISAPKK